MSALYEQTDGVAMGSPLGPLLANVFMSHIEESFATFAFKEARKGFFGCYSVCETMKDTKEG